MELVLTAPVRMWRTSLWGGVKMENDEDFWAEVKQLGPWLFAYTFFDQIVPHVSSPQAHQVIDRRFENFVRTFDRAQVPKDMTLIDFPCGDGYYSIRLAQAGFRVRGYDARPDNIERARFAARYHDVDVDFEVANFNDVESVRSIAPADIVACLGYFYHATNPALTLETLTNLAKQYVLLDSTTIKSKKAFFDLRYEGSEHLGHAVEGVRLFPTTAAFWKSAEYAGLKKLVEIDFDSLSGKTEPGFEWVGGLFTKDDSLLPNG